MQVTIKGGVFMSWREPDESGGPQFTWFRNHGGGLRAFGDWVPVVEHDITFTIPQGFEPARVSAEVFEGYRKRMEADMIKMQEAGEVAK